MTSIIGGDPGQTKLSADVVRSCVLAQHQRLRQAIGVALDLARDAGQGDAGAGRRLSAALGSLRAAIEEHVELEERTLIPRLRGADSFGEERVQRLLDEHERQREELTRYLTEDMLGSDLRLAAFALEGLLCAVLEDIDEEEREFLGPEVLCDDPLMVDQFTG
jgi:hypothetical protein